MTASTNSPGHDRSERPAMPDVRGAQRPRICSIPPYVSSAGAEAVELAKLAGLTLDPWQEFILTHALGERADGKWAAFEVGVVVGRQNGKGSVLEARELAGLFLLEEQTIIHSAHEFSTSRDHQRRLEALIEGTPDFDRRVMRVSRSHGDEGIELKGGKRILFRTRTKAGGRGYSADCIVLDEAMILPTAAHDSLVPTLSANPNPQVWYTGSAVDRLSNPNGVLLARLRERGLAGDDPSLFYAEWSVPQELEKVDDLVAGDAEMWAMANPALGIRISTEHVENERRSMDPRGFAVERLGAGDWPTDEGEELRLIDSAAWAKCVDQRSHIEGRKVLAFDIPKDRTACAIAVAGKRADGLPHVEIIEYRRGVSWVVDRLAELARKHEADVYCDDISGGASLIPELERQSVRVTRMGTREVTTATANFFDAIMAGSLRCFETEEMAAAVATAARRPVGESSWAWSRKLSAADATPLVSATLALWGFSQASDNTPHVFDLTETEAYKEWMRHNGHP